MKKTIRIYAALLAGLASASIARNCSAHEPRLTYEQAEKMGSLEDIVGYKNAQRYYTCKKLYADVGRVLEKPNIAQLGPKECPRGQRLADMCDSLPTDSPEKQNVKDAVAKFIAPRPCGPISTTDKKTAPETPQKVREDRDTLRDFLELQIQFADKIYEVMDAYENHRELKNPLSYAELKKTWNEYLSLEQSINTQFKELSQKILNKSITEKIVEVDPMIKPLIEWELKERGKNRR